jgi:hypothetical protein
LDYREGDALFINRIGCSREGDALFINRIGCSREGAPSSSTELAAVVIVSFWKLNSPYAGYAKQSVM